MKAQLEFRDAWMNYLYLPETRKWKAFITTVDGYELCSGFGNTPDEAWGVFLAKIDLREGGFV